MTSQGYLLDTNVISELCKARDKINPGVLQWTRAAASECLFTSVLVVGELNQGVMRLRKRDPVQADIIQVKLDQLRRYTRHALAIDLAVAKRWAELNSGDPLPVVDSLLAATALVHDLTVVTRNVDDFVRTAVPCINPFSETQT